MCVRRVRRRTTSRRALASPASACPKPLGSPCVCRPAARVLESQFQANRDPRKVGRCPSYGGNRLRSRTKWFKVIQVGPKRKLPPGSLRCVTRLLRVLEGPGAFRCVIYLDPASGSGPPHTHPWGANPSCVTQEPDIRARASVLQVEAPIQSPPGLPRREERRATGAGGPRSQAWAVSLCDPDRSRHPSGPRPPLL